MPGIIALDIDGTLTANRHLSSKVADYLNQLAHAGWQLIFITGRTFYTTHPSLEKLNFPYYLAVQNGAIILEMPSRQVIAKKYLSPSIFPALNEAYHGEESDYVIYSGYENGDKIYYNPKRFSSTLQKYIQKRCLFYNETWETVDSYDNLSFDSFASIKSFATYEDALRLTKKIEVLGLHVPLIRDPASTNYYVIQGTHQEINKGQALKELIFLKGMTGKIIAAGDDLNDLPMLNNADIKIVMANAPKVMLDIADIIAPPASEEGILVGLKEALK